MRRAPKPLFRLRRFPGRWQLLLGLWLFFEMAARTLDIKEPQVLVNCPAEALPWQHRVLLHRVEGGLWLGLSPDLDIVAVDLHTLRHHVLDRATFFPQRFVRDLYAFDPLDAQTLRDLKRQAVRRAALLGGGDVEDAQEYLWLVANSSDARFGTEVEQDLVDDDERFVRLGDRGVCMIDGEPRFVERVSRAEKDEWVRGRREDAEDIRVLGDHRSRVGRRDLDFRDAVESMKEETIADWPDQGPRACLEYLRSIALGAGNLLTYQAEWQRLSGVAEGGAQGHEHRCHLETLRRAICHDQLNVVNLASFEHIVRRVIQVEMAVERNPRHPDFSGLEDVVAGPRSASGSAHVSTYLAHVTGLQKDRANILKQQRLYQEEAAKRRGPNLDGKGADKGKNPKKEKKGSPPAGAGGEGG